MVFKEEKIYPRLATDMIIKDKEGRILLTKRNVEPYKNYWVFPGGHVKKETPVKAVKREVFEETELIVEVDKLYGVYANLYSDPRNPTVTIFYIGHIVGGEFNNTIEVSESKFFALDEIPAKIGFNHQEIIADLKNYPEGQPIK